MPGPVRLKVFVALLLSLAVAAFAAEAELSAEVPAEKWRALRLKGLTQGASLRVRVETSGPIRVILDNRKGDALREVKLFVEALPARRPQPKPAPPRPKAPGETAT